MGCKECEYQQFRGGETRCAKKPHDYVTPEQVEIVRWLLVAGRDAWKDAGCPGFKQWVSTPRDK